MHKVPDSLEPLQLLNGNQMIKVITGDLLEAKEKYIVHQTNCVTTQGGGLAKFLFKKFPYADIYTTRTKEDCDLATLRDKPGSITVSGNGQDERFIIHLMGQLYPGGFWDDMPEDSEEMRHKFFHRGLNNIARIPNLDSIAFPFKIGCGIAGGDWDWYLGELNNFANYVSRSQKANVVIYQREEDI